MSEQTLKDNTKYSNKIKMFIKDVNPPIRLDNINYKTNSINHIYNAIKQTKKNEYNYKI